MILISSFSALSEIAFYYLINLVDSFETIGLILILRNLILLGANRTEGSGVQLGIIYLIGLVALGYNNVDVYLVQQHVTAFISGPEARGRVRLSVDEDIGRVGSEELGKEGWRSDQSSGEEERSDSTSTSSSVQLDISDSSFSPRRRLLLLLSPSLPLFLYLLLSLSPTSQSSTTITLPSSICSSLPSTLSDRLCSSGRIYASTPDDSIDLVFSYYDEKIESFAAHVAEIRATSYPAQASRLRIFIYNKGSATESELRNGLTLRDEDYDNLGGGDYVIPLPNVGREGGSYLHVR
jgi:hypothetical protein